MQIEDIIEAKHAGDRRLRTASFTNRLEMESPST